MKTQPGEQIRRGKHAHKLCRTGARGSPEEQQRLTFRTSLLRYDVDWRLLLTRASIWKRGGAASSVAASQLCCRHPQQTPSRRSPRATAAGWLWDNVVAAALAPFLMNNRLFVHYLATGHSGALLRRLDWSIFMLLPSPRCPLDTHRVQDRLCAGQEKENWPGDPGDERRLPRHTQRSGWHTQLSESLFFRSRI